MLKLAPSMPKLRLTHKGILIAALPLMFCVLFVGILTYLLSLAEAETDEEHRRRSLLAASNQTMANNNNTFITLVFYGLARASYGPKMGSLENLERRYKQLRKENSECVARMLELSAGHRDEEKLTRRIYSLSKQVGVLFDQVKFVVEGGQPFTRLLVAKQKNQMSALVKQLANAEDELIKVVSSRQLRDPQERFKYHRWVTALLYGGILGALGMCVLLAVLITRGITGRLSTVQQNALLLAQQKPLIPRIRGDDEIAELDSVFHSMAEALAEASRKERAIIENALDVICSLSPELAFTKVNPASASVWGYAPDELIGRRLSDLILPDDIESTVASLSPGRLPASFESRFLRKDGQSVWILWSARWSAIESTIFCVAHNIEARKQAEERIKASEERIRTIMERMPVALVVLGSDSLITFCNQRMTDLTGVASAELLGCSFAALFPEHHPLNEKAFLELIRQRTRNDIFELDLQIQPANPRRVQLSLRTLAGLEAEQYLAAIVDVTERYKAQRMRQNLMAMISHDIRTPLSSIHAVLSLLQCGVLGKMTDDGRSRVAGAEQESKRLIRLFNDLLQVERQESEKLTIQPEPVKVAELIKRSLGAVRAEAERKEISIITAQPEEQVFADAGRIVQVLVNLLANAIKFSEKRSNINVATATNGSWLEIEVQDEGRGIPAGLEDEIFSPYKQAHPEDASIKGGVGLGLSICKSIIESHGGRIVARNNRDARGSCFSFTLPLAVGSWDQARSTVVAHNATSL